MEFALQLATQASGQTAPNPMVGAVLVNDGEIVGFGAHLKAGEPHAEVHAISMAGEKARGATLYVTLEPCSHFGKTPPCAHAVARAGIQKVVVAILDPNPLVAGNGISILKDAGVEVETGLLKEKAAELNKFFFHFVVNKTPYVTLKAASTLDGKTATAAGESKWITGKEAREDVHRLRELHDAILVGVNTVIADDPQLTSRRSNPVKQPVRIVLDTKLKTPASAKLVTEPDSQTWIITGSGAPEEKIKLLQQNTHVSIIKLETPQFNMKTVLKLLGERNITSLFVEGGGTVHGSFVREGVFQEAVFYIAPMLIGGAAAPSSVGGEGLSLLSDAKNLLFKEPVMMGKDLKITALPGRE
ncbi:bifunctional diaminohydroxyphosphoribosylaminopyrimidine deaminase/5-amino-6-(5-phosphoribosylamino)uracil reductase RibD [Bacillus lacus]|uniref:Riboflavin biosynthesis protein RibD n=2 Tax=Metabacillus lacus TaxID=1983721 RepID=A0A7X2LXT5_9BACI|nr:bifunctional diaminohydroxyphosphoribosylaminopyrimidine deaminase/5-amino-6-(5-phosphoribosylamino)uracil reductase RibD [Metabacillus lacus]